MIVHTRLDSPHLAGNLLGDPSERDLSSTYLRGTRTQSVGTRPPSCFTRVVLAPRRP
jgi:hypothetical protein